MVIYKKQAFVNLILVLIINKIILLTALYNLEKIYIYNKIANNIKDYYNNKNINKILKEFVDKSNQELIGQLNYKFIPDNLSIDCHEGINIYYLYLANTLHAYFAKRVNVVIEKSLLTKKHNLIKMILTIYPAAANINVTKEYIFFTEHNLLYKYIISQQKILIYNLSEQIIDYIIGTYYIYLRTKTDNNLYDMINIIYINEQDILTRTALTNIAKANSFFLKANYLIFLYYNAEPQIYKLINDYKFTIKKLNLGFNKIINNLEPSTNTINYNIYWDANKQTHIATTPLKTYEFQLPLDNAILSINFTK